MGGPSNRAARFLFAAAFFARRTFTRRFLPRVFPFAFPKWSALVAKLRCRFRYTARIGSIAFLRSMLPRWGES
jgi:hypothetical protein